MAICGKRQGEDRTDLVGERAVAPAGDRNQGKVGCEEELIERCDDEGRDRAAGRRGGDDGIVGARFWLSAANDAESACRRSAR